MIASTPAIWPSFFALPGSTNPDTLSLFCCMIFLGWRGRAMVKRFFAMTTLRGNLVVSYTPPNAAGALVSPRRSDTYSDRKDR